MVGSSMTMVRLMFVSCDSHKHWITIGFRNGWAPTFCCIKLIYLQYFGMYFQNSLAWNPKLPNPRSVAQHVIITCNKLSQRDVRFVNKGIHVAGMQSIIFDKDIYDPSVASIDPYIVDLKPRSCNVNYTSQTVLKSIIDTRMLDILTRYFQPVALHIIGNEFMDITLMEST